MCISTAHTKLYNNGNIIIVLSLVKYNYITTFSDFKTKVNSTILQATSYSMSVILGLVYIAIGTQSGTLTGQLLIVEHVETLAKSQLDQMFQQPTAAFLSELLTVTCKDV